jgi:hypothetical protein
LTKTNYIARKDELGEISAAMYETLNCRDTNKEILKSK